MAFVQISLLEGQLWEFELTVNENVISVGMMLEWLGGIRSVGFLGEVSLRKIVVTPNAEELTLTTEMVVEKSRW